MLIELRVKDFGIITETNWNLGEGLNIITGETGAGKSLVIDAVEALLGGRVDEADIRYGSDEARIEGTFALLDGFTASPFKDLLSEKGIATDDETLIISCAIRRQGRSTFRINGSAVPKSLVHKIGRLLIDIQGQSEHLALLDKRYHLDFLDTFGDTLNLRRAFSSQAVELHEIERELQSLIGRARDLARQTDFLSFQVNEIEQSQLYLGEDEDLKREKHILASAEKLKNLSYEAYLALCGNDMATSSTSAMDSLNESIRLMRELAAVDPSQEEHANILEETSYNIQEMARDIQTYSDNLEYDPERLTEIEVRLEFIADLKRKYGNSIAEIHDFLERAQMELGQLSHSSQRQNDLENEAATIQSEMGRMASELSQSRSQAAAQLISQVRAELDDLNMKQVKFEVSITPIENGDVIPLPNGEDRSFVSEGIDAVEFMAATNPGEPLKPLARIASTGEISRFMLALKGALSQTDDTPVVVFDEIDIGVGGRSGEILGRKLWDLSRNRQVICITHLPQIAAFADAHYSVHKQTDANRTASQLRTLTEESRTREIAAMLAGPKPSETAQDNARELMQQADTWKRSNST